MICTLTVARYPKHMGWAGVLSMAFFRIPLWCNRQLSFWKLLGCGRNGSFDKTPDWRQWAVLTVSETTINTPVFLAAWWKFFRCETWLVVLEPLAGHGTWDGKHCFGQLPAKSETTAPVAVLTRATIRFNRLNRFWSHVPDVANEMKSAEGLICSLGIGEVPWIKQATFSIWANIEQLQQFAYAQQHHTEVIRKTRAEKWYSEEMFVRFRIQAAGGTLQGKNPLAGKS